MQIDTTMLERKNLLKNAKTIAVIGLSPKEERPSNMVARYLLGQGYTIFPVNPGQTEILGQRCYSSLSEIPEKIDIVDVFRASEFIPAIVEETKKLGIENLWLQLGIDNPKAVAEARAAGILVVIDRCIKVDHEYFQQGNI